MSKRAPETGFTLDDTASEASKRVLASFTGGRDTVEEQRRLGGRPEICPVFDLYRFHFGRDDEHVERVHYECTEGIRLCGECKQEAAHLVKSYLEAHHKKRDSLMPDAKRLISQSRDYLASTGKA
jgi:tryptophanyl-tRNA synthetase